MAVHRSLKMIDKPKFDGPPVLVKQVKKVPASWKKGAVLRRQLLSALRQCSGNISQACEIAGVSRASFNYHRANYPEFRFAVEEILDSLIDEVESALMDQIRNGNTQATMFFLKTRGKDRGYVEQTNIREEREINVNFSYDVTESKQLDKVKDIMEAQILEQTRKLENGEL